MPELFKLYMSSIHSSAWVFPMIFGIMLMLPVLFLFACNRPYKVQIDLQPLLNKAFDAVFYGNGRFIVMEGKKRCPVCSRKLQTIAKQSGSRLLQCTNHEQNHRFIRAYNHLTLIKETI